MRGEGPGREGLSTGLYVSEKEPCRRQSKILAKSLKSACRVGSHMNYIKRKKSINCSFVSNKVNFNLSKKSFKNHIFNLP